MTLPVIDLGPFLYGSADDKRKLAAQVNTACRDTGFLIIVNHGVDPALPDRLFELAYQFFNQPFEEKLKVEKFEGSGPAGYHMFATQSNGLAYRNIQSKADLLKISPDLRESFGLSPERNGLNQWPAYPPGFCDVCLEYYARMETLAFSMIDLFTMALGLPEHFFDKFIDKHDSTVLMHHYPAQKEAPADGQLRSSPHTDLGMFTLLRHEREHKGGLQLKTKAGEWMDVPQVENAFVVNIADSMQQWTNDLWKSTFHRVLNPPRAADGSRRASPKGAPPEAEANAPFSPVVLRDHTARASPPGRNAGFRNPTLGSASIPCAGAIGPPAGRWTDHRLTGWLFWAAASATT